MEDAKTRTNAPLTESGRAVIESFEQFERKIWDFSKAIWFFTLLLPIALTLVVVAFIAVVQSPNDAYKFIIAAIATAVVFGRFVILFGQSADAQVAQLEEGSFWHEIYQELAQISSLELFLLVTYMDFVVAAFLAFHLGFMFRIPYLGPKAADLIGDTQSLVHDRPWIKRASVAVLIIFVIFPASSTGSVGGSIFGNLMGLSRFTTFVSIAIGSVLGNGLMYVLAGQINQYIDKDTWWVKLVGIAFCLALVVFLERRYRHMQKVALAEKQKQKE
ncbi:MAG: small multi-drug export protein [Planctomycetaceae bacterium]|nr:small multi-drug export protein [Planctomycetaceae bacterium]